jgi:hypothetical protein
VSDGETSSYLLKMARRYFYPLVLRLRRVSPFKCTSCSHVVFLCQASELGFICLLTLIIFCLKLCFRLVFICPFSLPVHYLVHFSILCKIRSSCSLQSSIVQCVIVGKARSGNNTAVAHRRCELAVPRCRLVACACSGNQSIAQFTYTIPSHISSPISDSLWTVIMSFLINF